MNIARLRAPIDSPQLAEFVAALDPVNAVADTAPGFVWRLQTSEGNATAIQAFEWETGDLIVNMSVWESVQALAGFVYGAGQHRDVLRRRREWFDRIAEAHLALWWIPRAHIPTTGEAEERVLHLRENGPTPHAFTLREHFPPPGSANREATESPDDWMCPA